MLLSSPEPSTKSVVLKSFSFVHVHQSGRTLQVKKYVFPRAKNTCVARGSGGYAIGIVGGWLSFRGLRKQLWRLVWLAGKFQRPKYSVGLGRLGPSGLFAWAQIEDIAARQHFESGL
jgi:hypothetical protein